MKHAGPDAIAALADLIAALRTRGLTERSPGVFYRRGKAWLHFHEDAAGLFADIQPQAEWIRMRVSGSEERASFLALVERSMERRPPSPTTGLTRAKRFCIEKAPPCDEA